MRPRKLVVRLIALGHRRPIHIRRVKRLIDAMRVGLQPREKGRTLERLISE